MAEGKKAFLIYCDILEQIEGLTNDEAGQLFKHVLRYTNDLNPTCDNRIVSIAFQPIKQQLKRDLRSYENKIGKCSVAGKLSAEKRRLEKLKLQQSSTSVESVKQSSTNPTVNVNVNVNDNDNDNVFIKSEFENSSVWKESICRDLKVNPSELENYCKEFLTEISLKEHDYEKGSDHENTKAAKSHFISWLKKKLEKDKPETKQIKTSLIFGKNGK